MALCIYFALKPGMQIIAYVLRHTTYGSTVLPYFLKVCRKNHNFQKKASDMKCEFCFSLQLLYERFVNPKRTEEGVIINVRKCQHKVPVTFVRF